MIPEKQEKVMTELKRQLEIIRRGTVELISEEELKEKIEKSLKTEKPLLIKAGFDPSAPDIHLGHTVLLRKMRHFQELGHQIVFLIGDFTGMIGDPTGKSEIRKRLTREEVLENAKTYQKQIFKILDPKKTKIVFNSYWFEKMTSYEFLELTSHLTVAQLLAREEFKQRYAQGKDISVLEFIYPLLQGYDSVELKADVELGGTDQKFNLLVGRQLQKDFNLPQQVVIMTPLLEGLDGIQKMSKSLGNYVGIVDGSSDMFGKIMSIPDGLMSRYYELLTDVPLDEIEKMKQDIKSGTLHPKKCKENLARYITEFYHGQENAGDAADKFNARHGKAKLGTGKTVRSEKTKEIDIYKTVKIKKSDWKEGKLWICRLLTFSGAVSSNSEARRLIMQKAIELNGDLITDINLELPSPIHAPQEEYLLKVGKKQFLRIKLDEE